MQSTANIKDIELLESIEEWLKDPNTSGTNETNPTIGYVEPKEGDVVTDTIIVISHVIDIAPHHYMLNDKPAGYHIHNLLKKHISEVDVYKTTPAESGFKTPLYISYRLRFKDLTQIYFDYFDH